MHVQANGGVGGLGATLKTDPSPRASGRLAERIFEEKAKWHRRQANASFESKLAVLDKLYEDARHLPKLERE